MRPVDSCKRLRECAHQQGLAETRNAFDEHVPGRHQREDHFLDHTRLPDDGLADAGAQFAEQLGRLLDGAGFSRFHVLTFLTVDDAWLIRVSRLHCAARVNCVSRGSSMRRPECSRIEAAELAECGHPLCGRHVVVTREAVDGRVAQRAQRGRVQCRSAPKRSANCPVPRICSASERRADSVGAVRGPKRGLARHNASPTPASSSSTRWRTEAPHQAQQRSVVFFGEEHDDVAALQLRRRHEQQRVVAEQEIAIIGTAWR